jgi:hypothetical protein
MLRMVRKKKDLIRGNQFCCLTYGFGLNDELGGCTHTVEVERLSTIANFATTVGNRGVSCLSTHRQRA